jgi:hypothetical protein
LAGLCSPADMSRLEQVLPTDAGSAGVRIFGNVGVADWLSGAAISNCVRSILGTRARPVRAILFDKTAKSNWSLGWHQDRTIAVRERIEFAGFDRWTVKSGAAHVEPPFSIIGNMLTARIHIDRVTKTNSPLLIAPGSYRFGRIAEARIDAVVGRCGVAACLADRGDAWLYRTAILHASERSSSRGRRRVLQVDFSADDLPGRLKWLGLG